tara:strand:+ start:2010 stop:2909 length:900 start_codon:yes stop_codon:yes gene_type:complete
MGIEELVDSNRIILSKLFTGHIALNSFKRLDKQTSSEMYSIDYKDKSYILRILNDEMPHDSKLCELESLKQADQLNIGPSILYLSEESDFIIYENIKSYKKIDINRNLKTLINKIKLIHNNMKMTVKIDIFSVIDNLYFMGTSQGIIFNDGIQEFLKLNSIIKKISYKLNIPTKACHNNLSSENILKCGRKIYLIDWESCGMGNPYYDLAYLSLVNNLDLLSKKKMLSLYFNEDNIKHFHFTYLMEVTSLFYQILIKKLIEVQFFKKDYRYLIKDQKILQKYYEKINNPLFYQSINYFK